jgi:hypothetical protein
MHDNHSNRATSPNQRHQEDGRGVESDGDAVKREICDDIAVAAAKARAAAAEAKAILAEMERDIDRAVDRGRFDVDRKR